MPMPISSLFTPTAKAKIRLFAQQFNEIHSKLLPLISKLDEIYKTQSGDYKFLQSFLYPIEDELFNHGYKISDTLSPSIPGQLTSKLESMLTRGSLSWPKLTEAYVKTAITGYLDYKFKNSTTADKIKYVNTVATDLKDAIEKYKQLQESDAITHLSERADKLLLDSNKKKESDSSVNSSRMELLKKYKRKIKKNFDAAEELVSNNRILKKMFLGEDNPWDEKNRWAGNILAAYAGKKIWFVFTRKDKKKTAGKRILDWAVELLSKKPYQLSSFASPEDVDVLFDDKSNNPSVALKMLVTKYKELHKTNKEEVAKAAEAPSGSPLGRIGFGEKRKDDVPFELNNKIEDKVYDALNGHVNDNTPASSADTSKIKSILRADLYPKIFNEPKQEFAYRGMRVSEEWLKKALQLKPSEKLPPNGTAEKDLTFTPKNGSTSSWTTDLSVAEDFSKKGYGSSSYRVVLYAKIEDNQDAFLDLTGGMYDKVAGFGAFKHEKESIGLGRIKVNKIVWNLNSGY